MHPQNVTSTLHILIIWALIIQKNIRSYIYIYIYGGYGWGACLASVLCLNSLFFQIFTRGNFPSYICLYLNNIPHINLISMQTIRRQFFVQSGDFCGHEYTICFCKELYISPYPQIGIFRNHVLYTRQLCDLECWQIYQVYILVILDITAFWKKYHLHYFIASCAYSSSISLDMCI